MGAFRWTSWDPNPRNNLNPLSDNEFILWFKHLETFSLVTFLLLSYTLALITNNNDKTRWDDAWLLITKFLFNWLNARNNSQNLSRICVKRELEIKVLVYYLNTEKLLWHIMSRSVFDHIIPWHRWMRDFRLM